MTAGKLARRIACLSTLSLLLLLAVIASPGASQPGETGGNDAERVAALRMNREGIAHLEAKRYRQAVEAFGKALDALPGDDTLRRNLATASAYVGVELMSAGRYADAEHILDRAVDLDPDRGRIHYYRAVLDFKRGRYEESVRRLEAVVQKAPDDAAGWETLGHACYRLDRLERTIEAWAKALALEPRDPDALRGYLERALKEAQFTRIRVAGRSRHFRVKADAARPGVERIAADVLQTLEDGYARVCADLGFYPGEEVTVVLYTRQDFERVTGMHHWVGGTFDGARIRVAVRDYDAHREAVHRMLVHELTHFVVLRLAGGCPVPAWINEGFARVQEGVTAAEAARELQELGGVAAAYELGRLERPFGRFREVADAQRAYAQSCSFTHFLIGLRTRRGVGRFIQLLRDAPEGGSSAAFRQAFGLDLADAVRQWKTSLAG